MTAFTVPTRDQVSDSSKAVFDNLEKSLGFVPNLYATLAHSPTALGDFLTASSRKSSLTNKEKEVINLVVSQSNDCSYCLAAHTAISKMNGFTDTEILDIRAGDSVGDSKFDALAAFVRSAAENNSKPTATALANLKAAGYTNENVVDTVLVISEITATNYLHGITQIPVDFPAAQSIETVSA